MLTLPTSFCQYPNYQYSTVLYLNIFFLYIICLANLYAVLTNGNQAYWGDYCVICLKGLTVVYIAEMKKWTWRKEVSIWCGTNQLWNYCNLEQLPLYEASVHKSGCISCQAILWLYRKVPLFYILGLDTYKPLAHILCKVSRINVSAVAILAFIV